MNKHLLRFSILFSFAALSFMPLLSSAQSKNSKEAAKKESSKGKDGKGTDLSSTPEMQAAKEPSGEKTYTDQSYSFLVLVNPNDEAALKLWMDIPRHIAGVKIEAWSGKDNAYIVFSRNPQMALFRRAYSSFFQIYSDEDLEMFGSALPCLAEVRPVMAAMTKKMSSN